MLMCPTIASTWRSSAAIRQATGQLVISGPLGNETRAWLDHLATGAPTVHTTPEQARINLETTIAIERAVVSGQSVRLPLQAED